MLIKDLLQQLVDDSKVNVEKCGNTNLYWSFKYDKFKSTNQQFENLNEKRKLKETKVIELNERILHLQSLRFSTPKYDRSVKLTTYNRLLEEKKSLQDKLTQLNGFEISVDLNKKIASLRESIEYYNDNLNALIYYFTKVSNSGIKEEQLKTMFDIPQDLDTLPIYE